MRRLGKRLRACNGTFLSLLRNLHCRTEKYFPRSQEEQYPNWSPRLRAFWRRGRNRVYAFWFIACAMSVVVATAITTDYVNWDEISRDFMPTNELSRAFLASFILVMDLMIVMQVPFTISNNEASSDANFR